VPLSPEERRRYERQIALPGFGEAGQEKLRASKVLIVGAGGLGSAAGYYLAAAGVGAIGLLDGDVVEPSNLQRQVLHFTEDVGRLKVESAAAKLRALNPGVEVRAIPQRLSPANAPAILAGYDFVLDCTDSFASKYLIADACADAGKPYSHAGIHRFEGQTMTVIPGKTACLRCLLPRTPEDLPDPARGPLGAIPGVIGTIQATEAIKYLLGIGRLLTDRLLVYDALEMRFRSIGLRRVPGCPLCGRGC
jgi:molybdopterin/thiamine biosynthesis adenylyltransferase